jgi:hypothetical protein
VNFILTLLACILEKKARLHIQPGSDWRPLQLRSKTFKFCTRGLEKTSRGTLVMFRPRRSKKLWHDLVALCKIFSFSLSPEGLLIFPTWRERFQLQKIVTAGTVDPSVTQIYAITLLTKVLTNWFLTTFLSKRKISKCKILIPSLN